MLNVLPLTLSPAGPEDADELTSIAQDAKGYWGYPPHWMALWREQLTLAPADLIGQAAFVAQLDGRPVGFYVLSQCDGDVSLEHLWVLPEVMGHGVGRMLFVHAVEQACLNGASALHVESDPHAAGFYERMGCSVVGVRVYELAGELRRIPLLLLPLRPAQAPTP